MTQANKNLKKANNAQKQFEALQKSLNARITSAENENQAGNLRTELKQFTLPVIEYASAQGFDIDALAKTIAKSDKKDADFLAVYALQKVRKTLTALAQGITKSFDPYTRTILANLVHDTQNNKTALVSLSRSIAFDEFDTQKKISTRYNCHAGTAGTQMSSTRQALRVLNIATVTKNRNNDEFALTDSVFANKVRDMFTVKA